MKRKLLLVCMGIFSLCWLTAQTIIPATSTGGNDVWYHVKCSPRNPNKPAAMWLTGADNGLGITVNEFAVDDSQLWKAVPNGTGVALVNKAYNNYMNADLRDPQNTLVQLTMVAAPPATALKFVPNSTTAFAGETGVCIIDVNTAVDANNNITLDANNSFAFYSAGSGSNYTPVVLTRYILSHSVAIFYTYKDFLLGAIKRAQTTLDKSAQGFNPGQYLEESRTNLTYAIEAAQLEADNANTTPARFMEAATELDGVIASFKQTAIFPEVSIGGTSKWYYLQGTRPANTYMTSTGASGTVKDLPIIPDDTQLWKMVPGNTGFYLQNKASGEYLNTDPEPGDAGVILNTQANPPTSELRFLISNESNDNTARFWIENVTGSTPNVRLHAGGSYHNYSLMNWTGGADDNSSWLIMDYAVAQRGFLKGVLDNAKTFIQNCSAGTNPGQVRQVDIDAYNTVLTAAQATYDDTNKSADDYTTAMTNLNAAKATIIANAVTPTISTDASTTWYTIQGLRPMLKSLIASSATSDSIKYQSLQNNDAELWKFVANGSGFAIQNKATGKYLDADGGDGTELITVEAKPTTALKFKTSESMINKTFRFWIENAATDVTFRLHAGELTTMNYIADPNDNCVWLVAEASGAMAAEFSNLKEHIKSVLGQTAAGTEYGKYPAANFASLQALLADAETVNLATITKEELTTKLANLKSSFDSFKASKISDITTITSTVENPKWFFITGNNSNGAAGYNKRVAKSQDKVRGAAKSDSSTDQMWRFELNPDDPTTVKIINKTAGEQFSIAGESTIGSMVTDGGTFFSLSTHGDGFSVLITYGGEPIHCDGSLQIVGWYDTINPNSAWRIDAVSTTATKNISTNKLNIRCTNGVLTVEGVEHFELYSIMGQKLNNKSTLRKGVYIVKAGNQTQKYIVR